MSMVSIDRNKNTRWLFMQRIKKDGFKLILQGYFGTFSNCHVYHVSIKYARQINFLNSNKFAQFKSIQIKSSIHKC